jgi:hypothetical protein
MSFNWRQNTENILLFRIGLNKLVFINLGKAKN